MLHTLSHLVKLSYLQSSLTAGTSFDGECLVVQTLFAMAIIVCSCTLRISFGERKIELSVVLQGDVKSKAMSIEDLMPKRNFIYVHCPVSGAVEPLFKYVFQRK